MVFIFPFLVAFVYKLKQNKLAKLRRCVSHVGFGQKSLGSAKSYPKPIFSLNETILRRFRKVGEKPEKSDNKVGKKQNKSTKKRQKKSREKVEKSPKASHNNSKKILENKSKIKVRKKIKIRKK